MTNESALAMQRAIVRFMRNAATGYAVKDDANGAAALLKLAVVIESGAHLAEREE